MAYTSIGQYTWDTGKHLAQEGGKVHLFILFEIMIVLFKILNTMLVISHSYNNINLIKTLTIIFLVPSVVHRSNEAINGGFSNRSIAVSNKGANGIGDVILQQLSHVCAESRLETKFAFRDTNKRILIVFEADWIK